MVRAAMDGNDRAVALVQLFAPLLGESYRGGFAERNPSMRPRSSASPRIRPIQE